MAVTYSATPLGAYRSAVRNSLISNKIGELETLTLVHRLGACPHEIRFALRAGGASYLCPSSISVLPQITSLNASLAVIAFGVAATNVATTQYWDMICEYTPTIVQ